MCSHHHHNGKKIFSECGSSTATRYTNTVYTSPPPALQETGKYNAGSCMKNIFKNVCCAGESVECASAFGDNHHKSCGTLTTIDSSFKYVSTLNGMITCAVLSQPRTLKCVNTRCRKTERQATPGAAAASSIQDQSETEAPTTEVEANKHIGKYLKHTNFVLPTNTIATSITTTSWASTPSVRSSSVHNFEKCLTAEEKSIFLKNFLAKNPPLDNSCSFVQSEFVLRPTNDIFCFNLKSSSAIEKDFLHNLLSKSLSHFYHPKKIFIITCQNLQPQWLSRTVINAKCSTSNTISLKRVQKLNYNIPSVCNISNVFLIIHNEEVNNSNENVKNFFVTTQSSLKLATLSSSVRATAGVAVGIVSFKNYKKNSFEVVEETDNAEKVEKAENATDDNTRVFQHNKTHKVCDDTRCQTSSFYSIHKTNTSPTSHFTLSPETEKKASHSLFKVSDVQKQSNSNNNKTNRINSNNNNEQQHNVSTIPSNVSNKKNRHLVEDDAFKASQRLKRLEENFEGLTFVRKIKKIRQSTDEGISVSTHNFPQNQLSEKTKSSLKGIKGKNTRYPLCKRDSIKVFLTSKKEEGESFTNTSIEDNDIVKCNDRVFQTPIKNNYLSKINNNCNLVSESGSLCNFNIKTNRFNETTSKCFNDFYDLSAPIYSSLIPKKSARYNLEKKDFLYINRPVPSISEFDVRQFSDLHSFRSKNNQLYEDILRFDCYDELLDDNEDCSGDLKSSIFFANDKNDCNNNVCKLKCQDLCLEKVENPATNHFSGYYNSSVEQTIIGNLDRSTEAVESKMRETNGQLRGLLKKPNRPPPVRKNRVVFDETRNEFFEADYIILIREDCAYDEEDEEPCTCGEHELVRLCCEEGCQCNYTNENTRTPQSPKFAPPIEFVDEAALSPPDDYKDNGLKNSLSGALSGHIFGAQHIQQLQVIQRLQQQRAAMLAARNNHQAQQPHVPPVPNSGALGAAQQTPEPTTHAAVTPQIAAATTAQSQSQAPTQLRIHSRDEDTQPVCTECAECVECAAKQLQESERTSPQCQEDVAQLSVPTVALLPLHNSSPERRITQKEIIAGEERPKYILQTQYTPSSNEKDKNISVHKNSRFVVESITMTTVTERRIVRAAPEDISTTTAAPVVLQTVTAPTISTVGIGNAALSTTSSLSESTEIITEQKSPISPKDSSPTQISGILKGGKLWKQESISQSDDVNTSSEDDTNTKRSVRFVTEDTLSAFRDGDGQAAPDSPEHDSQINDLIPIKKHSTLFTNALRPNSAMRQLFPTAVHQTSTVLTHEALRAFDESKRAGNLLPNLIGAMPGDSDTVRRNIERNILRRSLIKKKVIKSDISLEERIKQLTCDIDESNEDQGQDSNDENGKGTILNGEPLNHRGSPTGEENPQQKYSNDKSFSPSSSVSSSSSGSSSAYKKISDIFNRDRKQEKIVETEENPIVIIPQECRCPAAPDLGMGIQVPVVHTQIHRTPPRQAEPKRQFLSTLAPLTACVAGQKDDLSYYTLAAADSSSSVNTHFAQYNMGDIEPILCNDEMRKVAPDVIAGTPGQEQDELAAFAQQEAIRTEKIKKRYSNENSNVSSDDDEQNDYGFNKRPSVRGIKPKFSSTNEILQQMQDQLNKSMPSIQNDTSIKSYTLPKQASSSSINKQIQNIQPQNPQIPAAASISQQQTERTWSFYGDPEQQRIPIDGNIHPGYYQTMPTVFQQTFQGQEETLLYQNCVTMEQHYGRYARSPTRRPESPPPLRNYHQTMVLIPYNAETYSQFAATSVDPKVAQIQRQNILEYQQVTQQTIRVPISYALPAMQLHVVAGRGQATQQYTQHQPQLLTSQQPSQRILGPRYSMPQDETMGFSERGVPEGAASVSHTDCKGIVSPTTQANQPHQQQQHQQIPNCNQSTVTSTGPPGSVFYTMNV